MSVVGVLIAEYKRIVVSAGVRRLSDKPLTAETNRVRASLNRTVSLIILTTENKRLNCASMILTVSRAGERINEMIRASVSPTVVVSLAVLSAE
jgi:hypothetical protein